MESSIFTHSKLGRSKAGTGTLVFAGADANTYTGPTTVTAGQLDLNKPAGTNAIAGDLFIGDGTGTDTVRLLASDQIADTANVTLAPASMLHVNNLTEIMGSLQGAGTVQIGTGSVTAASLGAGVGNVGTLSVTATGSGSFSLTNTAPVAFELEDPAQVGIVNDLVTITGGLFTLDGILNISDPNLGTAFAAGTYRLFNYTGTLVDNLLSIGAVPDAGFFYSVETSTVGEVNLVVAVPEPSTGISLVGGLALLTGWQRLRRRPRGQ